MNNAHYLTFMEACQFDFAMRTGYGLYSIKNGCSAIMGSQHIIYKKALRCFQKFRVRTQVVYWDDKWIYFEHRFERGDRLVALGYIKSILLKKGGHLHPKEMAMACGVDCPPLAKREIVEKIERFEVGF